MDQVSDIALLVIMLVVTIIILRASFTIIEEVLLKIIEIIPVIVQFIVNQIRRIF